MPFLDTTVLLRHFLGDHPEQSPRATAFLGRVERGEVQVHISDTVIFETVFTLQRTYRLAKQDIRDAVIPLLELPDVVIPGKRRLRRAFELYIDLNLPFADAYHAAMTEWLNLDEIVSFDRDFDRVPGIERVEP